MSPDLLLAIPTYRRPQKLDRCLESIVKQSVLPSQVVVVDNDKQKTAQKTTIKYRRKLPLRYLVEPKKGAPRARNRALKICKISLLGYTDDDCILDKDWVRNATQAMEKRRAQFVVGRSMLLNSNNIYAKAQFRIYKYWFNGLLNLKTGKTKPQALDTKNIVMDAQFLKKNHLVFDSRFGIFQTSGFEDIDLGLQLKKKKGQGIYEGKMIVYHEEVDSFYQMLRKAYQRGILRHKLCQKWNMEDDYANYLDLRIYRNPLLYSFRFTRKTYRLIKKMANVLQKKNRQLEHKRFEEIKLLLLTEIIEQAFSQGYLTQKGKVQRTTDTKK